MVLDERTVKMSKRRNSRRQRIANIENAKLSTGPRTPEGKAVSSQNARKVPRTFKEVSLERLIEGFLLKGECEDGLRLLRDQHVADFRPRNPTEYGIVEQMASVMAETERLQISKRSILAALSAKQTGVSDNVKIAKALNEAYQSKGFLNLDRAISRLRRDFSNLVTTLNKARKLRADNATDTTSSPADLQQFENAEAPEIKFNNSNRSNEIFMEISAPPTPVSTHKTPPASPPEPLAA